MDVFNFRKELRGEWIVAAATAALLFLVPAKIKKERTLQISSGLTIQTSKTSPSRIAFDEARVRGLTFDQELNLAGLTSAATIDLNQAIGLRSIGSTVRYLSTKRLSLPALEIPRESALRVLQERSWMEHLSPEQSKRIREADSRSEILSQDWDLPSPTKLIQDKLGEIKAQTVSESESGVYVAGTDVDGNWKTKQEAFANTGVEPRPAAASATEEKTSSNGVSVSGQLLVDAEAPFGPDRHIEVRWFDEGISKAVGRIDEKNWRYSISIPEKSGTVIAAMIDGQGREVATGAFRIPTNSSERIIANAEIQIRPRSRFAGAFSDFYQQGGNKLMSAPATLRKALEPRYLLTAHNIESKAEMDGTLHVDRVHENSWSFLRAEHEGYYPALYLIRAGQTENLPMIPRKTMVAFLSIVRDQFGSMSGGETGAVIWGQLQSSLGQLRGYRVEIEGHPEFEPVYLNELLIPDGQLKETSTNGYFAFVDLPRGFYSLRVLKGELQAGFVNIEADEGTVSPVGIDLSVEKEKIPVKVFDAFTGSMAQADVDFQQLSERISVSGVGEILAPQTRALALLQVDPTSQAYLSAIYSMPGDQDHVDLPLVSSAWILGLKQRQQLSEAPGTGLVVGFVPIGDYELSLGHLEAAGPGQVVYFNAQGEVVPKGIGGGGFVVFNVPPGSQTVSVYLEQDDKVISRVIPVDANWTQVLQFSF
jgi:hypothetical protein